MNPKEALENKINSGFIRFPHLHSGNLETVYVYTHTHTTGQKFDPIFTFFLTMKFNVSFK